MFRKRWTGEDEKPREIKDVVKAREQTMNRAVRLLAAKPRSIGELQSRLLEKNWTNEEIVGSVIEKLKEYKYLDDRQFAQSLALSKLRQKPQGKRRLQQTMSQKQLPKEIVDDAIVSAFEKMPEVDLIKIAIEKRLRIKGIPASREETKKFYDHLLRQGFGFDLIRDKMREVGKIRVEETEEDED